MIKIIKYFSKSLLTVVGIVLVWRSIWTILDVIDEKFFGGNNLYLAFGGLVAGLLMLFLPDKDLKEIEGPAGT